MNSVANLSVTRRITFSAFPSRNCYIEYADRWGRPGCYRNQEGHRRNGSSSRTSSIFRRVDLVEAQM